MKKLSEKIKEIEALITQENIKSVSFDIDGTLYPMRKVEIRWWLAFMKNPIRAMRFIAIRKKWEKRRRGIQDIGIDDFEVIFFENFLGTLLDKSLISSDMRTWLFSLQNRGIKIFLLSDHGTEVKASALEVEIGIPINCLIEAGELKPHKKISDLLKVKYSIESDSHLHLGDRWTDEEQARILNCSFSYLKC